MKRLSLRLTLAAAISASLLAMSASGASAFYQFRIVGAHAQFIGGTAGVNNAGIVYGIAEMNHVLNVPFIWRPGGQPTTNDPNQPPADPSSYDDGYIVGVDPLGNDAGVDEFTGVNDYWAEANGVSYILTFEPQAMNDNDVVVGDDGNIMQLSPTVAASAGIGSMLVGISNDNQIIGTDSAMVGAYWTWTGGDTATEHPIPLPPGATRVQPVFINNQDDIVGYTFTGNDFFYHIGDASSSYLPPTVGALDGFSDQDAVLYDNGTAFSSYALYQPQTNFTQSVHSLLPPSAWTLEYAVGVNASDEVAAGGSLNGAVSVPVELLPNLPLSSQPDPGVQSHGRIHYVLHLPTIPVILQWKPRPPEGDPAYLEHLETSLNAGKSWQTIKLAKSTAAKQAINATPGSTYQARSAVTDDLLQTSKWATGNPFTPALVDNADKAVSESAEWKPVSDKKAVDGTLSETSTAGGEAAWTFTGQSFGVIARTQPSAGSVTVVVDGISQGQVSFASKTTKEGEVVYALNNLSAGSHIVKLVADGDGSVDLDGFAAIE